MAKRELTKRIEKLEAEERQDLLCPKGPKAADAELVARKVSDPLKWIQYYTKTKDPHWREAGAKSPYRPFPDKPYFRPILEAIEREPVLFIAKSRDLMISWLCVAYFTHACMLHPGLEVLFQSQTEEKAAELVDYARTLYDQQGDDLRVQYPLPQPTSRQNSLELMFSNGSRIVGIPHGADKIRSYHPTSLFIDEAAFVPDAGESYDEAISACQKIVVVSSANVGWFEGVCVSADNPKQIVRGLTEKRTSQGIAVYTTHYTADPDRANPKWKEQERRKYTSEGAWQREQEIVFSAGGGERLFAEILNRWGHKIIVDPETSGFQPSPQWDRLGGFDYGKANPTAALVATVDYDGTIYILREYYQPGMSPKQHVPWITQLKDFRSTEMYSDPSIFYQTQAQADGTFKAIASMFAEEGINNLTPAPENNELLGMERILSHWMNLDEREPTLKILCPKRLQDIAKPEYGIVNEGCPNLLWELRRARREELTATQLTSKNPTEKIVDKDNHLRDCLKYLCLTQPYPSRKTAHQLAVEKTKPLVEIGDLTSALIRYQQEMAELNAERKPIYVGRYRSRRCSSRIPYYLQH